MTDFFRHTIVIFICSAALFLGFALRAIVSVSAKSYHLSIDMEDDFTAEKNKNTKEDKSGRPDKKICYFDVPLPHQLSHKCPMALTAHDRVYLLAVLSEPLIRIPIEPPEPA